MIIINDINNNKFKNIDYINNFVFSYAQMKELFNQYINTEKYYSIIKYNIVIYTNLYDIIKDENYIIDDIPLNIIFLSYEKYEVDKIKKWKPIYPINFNIRLNNNLIKDKLYALMMVNHCGMFYNLIHSSLKNDEQIIKTAVLSKYYTYKSLQFIPEEYKINKNFFLYICNLEGTNIKYASDELKDDIELVNIALNNNINTFQYISQNLKNNNKIIEKCIKILEFKNKNTFILRYITSTEIKDNKDIIIKLMKYNGFELEYVSNRLRNDIDVVSAAIMNYTGAYFYGNINKSLINNKKIILLVLNQPFDMWDIEDYENFLDKLDDDILDDEEIVLAAINKSGRNYKYISNRLKNNKDILIKCLSNCYDTSEYIDDGSDDGNDNYNRDYIKYIKNLEDEMEYILKYAPELLKKDSDVLQAIINISKYFLSNIYKAVKIT